LWYRRTSQIEFDAVCADLAIETIQGPEAKAYIIAIDYLRRERVKIWGRARVIEDDAALVARLLPQAYRAKAEQAIVFEVEAWCTNCPSHIPQMLPAGEVAAVMAELQRRIRELEAENAALREHRPASGGEDA
jgi:uncharacterized protein